MSSSKRREKAPNPDATLVARANEYGRRIADIEMAELEPRLMCSSPDCLAMLRRHIDNAVSNAFVVGYAAGHEEAIVHMPSGRRRR